MAFQTQQEFVAPVSHERLQSGAKIVPRNTLALWGVGARSHKTFFWDGKLIEKESGVLSQFGTRPPSQDPLITAVHLPAVEIRETLEEDAFVRANKTESVSGVRLVYAAILANLRERENQGIRMLAHALDIEPHDVTFLQVSRAIAAFIRSEFRIRETKLQRFMTGASTLTSRAQGGGVVLWQRRLRGLPQGALFSDQKFHSIPCRRSASEKMALELTTGASTHPSTPLICINSERRYCTTSLKLPLTVTPDRCEP